MEIKCQAKLFISPKIFDRPLFNNRRTITTTSSDRDGVRVAIVINGCDGFDERLALREGCPPPRIVAVFYEPS